MEVEGVEEGGRGVENVDWWGGEGGEGGEGCVEVEDEGGGWDA